MSNVISIDELQKEFTKICEEYVGEVNEIVREETGKAIRSAAKELKNVSPKKSGDYAKDWTSSITKGRTNTEGVAYNKRHYQLTHLLENGHASRGGGRSTPAHKHIGPVNQKIIESFYQGVIRRL